MSAVRAKFQVMSAKHAVDREGKFSTVEVEMMPVYGREGEANHAWSKYTPTGKLSMHITNEALRDTFRPGQAYFLDFTLAEESDEPA